MKRIYRIGLDFDGVIVDHAQNKVRVALKFGIKLAPWETPASIMRTKIDPATYNEIQSIIYDDPEVALTPPLMYGIESCLARLKELGLPTFLISRNPSVDTVIKLLEKHDLWEKYFNEGNVVFAKDKIGKDAEARRLNIDVYLDDEPEVLTLMRSVPHRFLIDPFGVCPRNDKIYTKVWTWPEFLHKVQSL